MLLRQSFTRLQPVARPLLARHICRQFTVQFGDVVDANLGFSVPYEKRASQLGGTGLFATEPIKAGTRIWTFSDTNCCTYSTPEEIQQLFARLTPSQIEDFVVHAYSDNDVVISILDDGRFWNHSANPNCGSWEGDEDNTYAIRDIESGEELLDDYGDYQDLQWFEELCEGTGHTSVAKFFKETT